MMRVGLDIDGVIYKWADTARYLLNTQRGYSLGESTHWDYLQYNVSGEDWNWLWKEGVQLGLFRYGHLYKGAIEGIKALAALAEIHVVTHRPQQAINDTLAFLSYLTGTPEMLGVFSGVHILTEQEPKSSIGADVYIDDSADVADELVRAQRVCLLWDRPWNQGFQHATLFQRATRVRSWEEVLRYIDNLKESACH